MIFRRQVGFLVDLKNIFDVKVICEAKSTIFEAFFVIKNCFHGYLVPSNNERLKTRQF